MSHNLLGIRSGRLRRLVILSAAAAALSACASDLEPIGMSADASPVQAGRQIAQRQCASCHAIGELGSSPRAEVPPLRDVLNEVSLGRLEMSFEEGMMVGHEDMPIFKLSPSETEALLAYLKDIEEPQGPSPSSTPGAVDEF